MAETATDLYKAETVEPRVTRKSFDSAEYAVAKWLERRHNKRLLDALGDIPPAEAEAAYWNALEPAAIAARL